MKWILAFVLSWHLIPCATQEYHFRQMPMDYGKDIQLIKNIFQSADQMIWLGTDKGLFSFDGKSYQHFPRTDEKINAVSTIAEHTGEIWIGYDDGHIQIISNDSSKTIRTDSTQDIPISKILFHENGSVYIATYGAGLWKLEKNSFTKIRLKEPATINDIYDALIDASGKIWIATDHGIWIYPAQSAEPVTHLTHADGLPDNIVTELTEGQNRNIWIGLYDHGFASYDLKTNVIQSEILTNEQDGNIAGLAGGNNHWIWAATEKSIYRISPGGISRKIKLPVQINDRIEAILFDRTGNLWIASGNKIHVANSQLEFFNPGIKGIQALTTLNNQVWLGSETGLYSMQSDSSPPRKMLDNLDLNILSLFHDDRGLLWIGTFGQGLIIYNPENNRHLQLKEEDGISNNSILNIDGYKNKIWLATLGGITEIDHSAGDPFSKRPTILLYSEKHNFPAGYVYDVYIDKTGITWFGTDGKGLYYMDDLQLKLLTKPIQLFQGDSFDLRTIYSISEGDSNTIWVSAQKGNILQLDKDGNILSHISSPFGSLNSLATAGNGEVVIMREGSLQVKNPVSGIFALGSSTGLTTFAPNINASAVDSDGSVWIADTDKVLHYHQTSSDTSHYVHMHMVDVTPGSLQLSDPIVLRPDSNFIDFRFTGLWYADPQGVRYKYKLEGHDQDWIYTQEGRAVYSKLAPGTYTFIVSGSHNDDFTHSIPIRRKITVLPPFYMTWWFVLGVIFLIGLLTYIFTRGRIRRVKRFHQLEKEKTTYQLNAIQAQVNPHFLFNSFNTLSGIIEEDQEAAVDYVDQLSSFFRGVLQHRNAELITVAEEIEIMRNYTYILKKRYGSNIKVVEEIIDRDGYVAPLTLQLLVENAIKHNIASGDRPLTIHIRINGKWLEVSNPIQPKIQSITESTGFGLSSLLTRYQYLTRTNIEIINDGNIFTVRIPVIHPNSQA